jgi:hypothetical protein
MKKLPKAKFPFEFYSRLHLRELTGLRASTIPQLLNHVRNVPGSVIYNHTHHFLEQHERLVPGVPNDFAYWVSEVMGEGRLGEKLSAIDTTSYGSIRELRDGISAVIDEALKEMPSLGIKMAPKGEEFYFMKTKSFVFKTAYRATNLREFADCMEHATPTTTYFHIFESKLRYDRPTNDFSEWLLLGVGEKELAEKVARLNAYDYSLVALRKKIIEMIRQRIGEA